MEPIVPSTKQWTESKEVRKARKREEKNAKIDKLPKDNYVVCLKHGEKYSADYVNKLHSMVSRNCSIPFEFICFTENTKGINKDIRIEPLPKIKSQGWWYKPMFVGADLPIRGTLLFLDLDVIVFQNIDKLFTYKPNKFCICRDFNRSIRHNWDKMNSSVFRIPVGMYDNLWKDFLNNTQSHVTRNRGDQDWMYRHIHNHEFWPDEWIKSYKWEMRDRRDLGIINAKRNFKVDAPPKINNDTSIAVFHGDPNPADANDSWVKNNWT